MTVIALHTVSLADIPAQLRDLAEAIDGGVHGEAVSCAVVLRTNDMVEVFAFGKSDAVAAFMDLHAGAQALLR